MDDMLKKLWRSRPRKGSRSKRKEPRLAGGSRSRSFRWNAAERKKRRKIAKESRRKNRRK